MTRGAIAVLAGCALLVCAGVAWADDDDLEFEAELSGAQQVTGRLPDGVDTDGEGKVSADFDDELTKVRVKLRVEDTEGDVIAAHFHCGRPGENGPVAFGLMSPGPCEFDDGRLRCTLTNENLTDISGECTRVVGRPVTNIAALAFAMRAGLIYLNVHTRAFSAGSPLRR